MPPDDVRERVAVLEQMARSTDATLKEIKDDLRELGRKHDRLVDKQDTDFRLIFKALIATALGLGTLMLGLAGLMAKGFRWF